MDLETFLSAALAELKQKNLYRALPGPDSGAAGFSRNTYLGHHFGASGSRLISGNHKIYAVLEQALADWKQTGAALVFPTGYMTNVGALPALMGKHDLLILDKLCHASLIDGARLSGADLRVFKHNDARDLARILSQTGAKYSKILVITEAVFSMDGDLAPLKALTELRAQYGCWLGVDEAHAVGVFGARGAGLAEELGLTGQIDLSIGTFSKALDSLGGYAAGSQLLIDYLVNRARPFIYSTALPPSVLRANLKHLRRLQSRKLRQKLWQNIEYFCGKLNVPARSAIVPVLVGDEGAALQMAEKLRRQGFLIPAIRYPTVPKGQARLRITLSAAQTRRQLDSLLKLLV
ncbi:MAG: 8-amino-7-oxononanoate synthase [Candidatus Margulisbacteria bacterium]|jgi:8-amino-7-oxononanoate synthase|nr:8-amino-7-oxononanoate synthase [Candidatus Margulisiibacteriota bacterium]